MAAPSPTSSGAADAGGPENPPLWLPAVLAAALAAVSAAGVLVRLTEGPAPATIAWWRCLGAAIVLLPFTTRLPARHLPRVALAGVFLGAHFGTWFESLYAASVLHSTVLVCLSPLWVGLGEAFLLGRPPSRAFWIGTVAAVVGTVVMVVTQDGAMAPLVPSTPYGLAMATLAGLLGGAYLLVGRVVRQDVDILPYMGGVTTVAALALSPILFLGDLDVTGFSWTTWAFLAASVAVPQLIGHMGLNTAVRWVPAARLSTLLLLEPLGAAILAGFVLGEWPPAVAWTGAALTLLGVGWAQRSERAAARSAPAAGPT